MKKIFFLPLAVILLLSFQVQDQNASATVNQYSGIYVFSDCQPFAKYKVLGTVKVAVASSGQYEPVRDKLLKKAKKEFPECQGVILNLSYGRADQADCIVFE